MSWSAMLHLERRHAVHGAGRCTDLGREVGHRRQVVAERGAHRGEPVTGELHPVAGVAGEADDEVIEDASPSVGVPTVRSCRSCLYPPGSPDGRLPTSPCRPGTVAGALRIQRSGDACVYPSGTLGNRVGVADALCRRSRQASERSRRRRSATRRSPRSPPCFARLDPARGGTGRRLPDGIAARRSDRCRAGRRSPTRGSIRPPTPTLDGARRRPTRSTRWPSPPARARRATAAICCRARPRPGRPNASSGSSSASSAASCARARSTA